MARHRMCSSCILYHSLVINICAPNEINVCFSSDSPSIHFQPNYSPYIVELNTPVTLKCVVDSNPPYQQLQWRRNGVPLPSMYRFFHVSDFIL